MFRGHKTSSINSGKNGFHLSARSGLMRKTNRYSRKKLSVKCALNETSNDQFKNFGWIEHTGASPYGLFFRHNGRKGALLAMVHLLGIPNRSTLLIQGAKSMNGTAQVSSDVVSTMTSSVP
jgi:hypothetical protein